MPPELREGRGQIGVAKERAVARGGLGPRGDLHMHARRGRTTARTRSRKWRPPPRPAATSTSRSPTTLTTCGKAASRLRRRRSRSCRRSCRRSFSRHRGQHPRRRDCGLSGRGPGKCDWVVASLHSAFDKSPTERILAAMENPHVDCIGHPTARKLNKRVGVDLDIEKIAAKGPRRGRPSRSTPSPTASTLRLPRAGRRRGGPADRDLDRLTRARRARLRGARRRPGPARLADEGSDPQLEALEDIK